MSKYVKVETIKMLALGFHIDVQDAVERLLHNAEIYDNTPQIAQELDKAILYDMSCEIAAKFSSWKADFSFVGWLMEYLPNKLKAAIEAEYVRIDDAAIEASVDIGCEIFHYVDIRLSKNDLENIERNALIHIRTRLQAILKELK